MKKLVSCLLLFTLAATGLSACSGGESVSSQQPPLSDSVPADSALSTPQNSQQSAWPRTIVDAEGHEIVLESAPKRIAILHSMYLEYFFVLGTPPTASAGANVGTAMKAMDEFETLAPYKGTADVIDLGSAREINLEAILEAEPDVIVTFSGHGGINEMYDQLIQIAPVVLLDYTASWQQSVRDCAEIVGKEDTAEQCIEETQAMMDDARKKLAENRDKTVVFVRSDQGGGIFAMGYERYPYYYDSENGFGLAKPEGYAAEWGSLSLEALAEMNPDYIIFQDFIADAKAQVDALSDMSVWQNLKAVKNGQVLFYDGSINTTSPLAIQVLSRHLVEDIA